MSVTPFDDAGTLFDDPSVPFDGAVIAPPIPVLSSRGGSGGAGAGAWLSPPPRIKSIVETKLHVPKPPRRNVTFDWNTALVLADFDVVEALLLMRQANPG
jgi:hypothetical protein